MTEPRDEVLERAVAALREMPPLDRDAVANVVAAAARARESDLEPSADDLLPLSSPRRGWRSAWAIAGIAAAAAFAGFLLRGAEQPSNGAESGQTVAASGTSAAPAIALPASGDAVAAELAPVPTQFVIDAPRASQVRVVGDFTRWGDGAVALSREPGSTLWTVTLPVAPGRHRYAFVVNGTWTLDPRAPRAPDDDFGVPGSVVIVGRP